MALGDEKVRVIIEGVDQASAVFAGLKKDADALNKSLKQIGIGLAATGTAITAVLGLSVMAAAEQERATETLGAAMKATGTFTEDALKRQLDFAAAMQRTTAFSDDQITKMQALLVQLGNLSGPGLEAATKATAGFAAVLGVDLDTAARQVSNVLQGSAVSVGRFNLGLKEGATAQERFNAVIAVGSQFFGTAEAQAATFTGRMTQFKNAVNDAGEAIGQVLLPMLTAFLKNMTAAINSFNDFAKAHPKLTSALVGLATAFAALALVVAPILVFWPQLVTLWKLTTIVLIPLAAALLPIIVETTAITAAIVAAWFAFVHFDDVLNAVLSSVTTLVATGFAMLLQAVESILELLAKLPIVGGAFNKLADQVEELRGKVDAFRSDQLEGLRNDLHNLGEDAKQFFGPLTAPFEGGASVSVGGAGAGDGGAMGPGADPTNIEGLTGKVAEAQGIWQGYFANLTAQQQQAFSTMDEVMNGFALGTIKFLDTMKQKWGDTFGAKEGGITNFVMNFVNTSATAISSQLGKAIGDIILGTKSASEAFKEFGKAIVEAIVRFVAEYVAQLIVAKAASLIMSTFIISTASAIAASWAPAAVLATIATLGAAAVQAPIAIGGAMATTAAMATAFSSGIGGVAMAEGGIVTSPTMALIGERGPEAVIPLDKAQGAGFGGGIHVSIMVDKAVIDTSERLDELAEKLTDKIGRLIEIRGMMPVGAQI